MFKNGAEQADTASTVLKLHFFYVVVILVGVIVLLATWHWTELKGFTEYLSVAATITSLVLGILAIIYSFVSSNSTNDSLGSIESAARDMRSLGADLSRVVSEGHQLQSRAQQRSEEFQALIGELHIAVENLSDKTTQIAGAVESLPSQFGELKDEVRKRAQSEPTSPAKESLRSSWTPEQVASFLSNTSFLGVVAAKALADAKTSNKYCDLKTLFNTEKIKSFDYVYGYLTAASSAGIFRYEHDGDGALSDGKTRISEASPELIQAIEEEWQTRTKTTDPVRKRSVDRYTPRIVASLYSPSAKPDA